MRFAFRPGLALASAAAFAILVALGVWQLHRLEWKQGLIARMEARIGAPPRPFDEVYAAWAEGTDTEYTPVVLEGRYAHAEEAHVFGSLDGAAGYYVFTPLDRGGAGIVYVNRGFVPQRLKSQNARADGLIAGDVRVEGLFRAPTRGGGLAGALRPANDPAANVWHARTPEAFAAAAGIVAVPVYLDSSGAENPGDWPKGGATRLDLPNRHFEYALTWFGLAAALVGVYLVFSLRRDVSTDVDDRASGRKSADQ